MTTVFVEASSTVLSHKRAKKQFGSWSSEREFGVVGVTLNKDAYFSPHLFEVPYEVNVGDKIFVLSMTYSSGDSFGTSRGNGDIIAIFKDQNLATEAAQEIRKDEDARDFEFTMEDGTKQKFHNSAYGYFEHITTVSVQGFIVSDSDLDIQQF